MKFLSYSVVLIMLALPSVCEARAMTLIRDLVSTSVRSATSTHEISFRLTAAVPASGKLVITPQAGGFTIPVTFDYTDVDFAVSTGGPYTERDLASVSSATEDGVTVVPGSSGSITIELNSSSGLLAGDRIRIYLGSNAVFGTTGDEFLTNPSSTGSYVIQINSRDASGVAIDDGATRVSIVRQVGMAAQVFLIPPGRSNGLPSGSISHGNGTIEISLNTDELATCRYATTTGVAYADMTGTFLQTSASLHTKVVSGHVDGTTYSYYVRCSDLQSTVNEDDYEINFILEATPSIPVSTGQTGGSQTYNPGGGGQGRIPGGANTLYLASVMLTGYAPPGTTVKIMKDGSSPITSQVSAVGTFQGTVTALERGAYTFTVYGIDGAGRESSLFYSTLTVGVGTNNALTDIIVPPTISLPEKEVGLGETALVQGASIPGDTVEVFVMPQGSGGLGTAQKFSTEIPAGSSSGAYEVEINTEGLPAATYIVRARTLHKGQESSYSRILFLGVGVAAAPDFGLRADLNKDGKVNLVDFSILLTSWNTGNATADINGDGRVGLSDFSILLFNWTG